MNDPFDDAPGKGTRPSFGRRARLGLAVGANAIGFGILLTELIARLVLTDFFVCDERLGWVFEPEKSGFRINRRYEYAARVQISSAGFHDVEHAVAKRAGTGRLILLGDSMLAGMQVSLDGSFSRQLQKRLKEGGAALEVINCATDGYGTAQEQLMLEERCGPYDPDVVVLGVYYYNDVRDNYIAGGSTNHPLAHRCGRPYFGLRAGVLTRLEDPTAREHADWGERVDRVLRYAYLYQVLVPYYDRKAGRAFRNQDVYRVVYTDEQEEAWEITHRLLLALEALASAHEAQLVVLLIPSRFEIFREWAREDWGSIDGLDFDRPRRRLREFLEANEMVYMDLAPTFSAHAARGGAAPFFRHDPHWSAAGNELASAAFYDWLRASCGALGLREGACGSGSSPP